MCNMLHMSVIENIPYKQMPPEPWGKRLGRARTQVAKMTLDDAVVAAGKYVRTTASTIARLEKCDVLPFGGVGRSRRELAAVLCLAYKVDPGEFGLGPDDYPPTVLTNVANEVATLGVDAFRCTAA